MTDDELISAVEDRLNGGHFGFHGLYSTNQINYREAWCDVMDWLHDRCNEDFERWNPHRQMMIAALERHGGDRVESRRRVFALNTTLHGREDEVH